MIKITRQKIFNFLSVSLVFSSVIFVSACKSKKDDEIFTPVETLYSNGTIFLEEGKYTKAAEEFSKVFFQHPGHELTPKAELMQAYSLYLDAQYEEAVDVLDTFIRLHPLNEEVDYAYYLKALSSYMQISSVKLDQSKTLEAKRYLEDVIKRFPNTKYAVDANLKMDLVNEHLAGQEMEVGRYYLEIKDPIAAVKRFQNVINHYQTTAHSEEALYRIVESLVALNLSSEAQKYAAVLGHNYPHGKWYQSAYHLMQHNSLAIDNNPSCCN